MTRFATRLNSFAAQADRAWPDHSGKPTLEMMVQRAASVPGLTHVDLNYPDHVAEAPRTILAKVNDLGLQVNGLAMRFYTNAAFKLGAFSNPDRSVRQEAIDLTKRGIDAAMAMDAPLMTLWLGQDGFDYSFQGDYGRMWDDEVGAIREVARHAADCMISIEYKANEPRSYALLPDAATTLLAIAETGCSNIGVTLDFAHVLYADEMPAYAATLIARKSRVLGVHLNDGYAKRDDGLMVGSVHPQATLELLWQISRDGYDGVIYFDTFPDASGIDPVEECRTNIKAVERFMQMAERVSADNALHEAIATQNSPLSQRAIARIMSGE